MWKKNLSFFLTLTVVFFPFYFANAGGVADFFTSVVATVIAPVIAPLLAPLALDPVIDFGTSDYLLCITGVFTANCPSNNNAPAAPSSECTPGDWDAANCRACSGLDLGGGNWGGQWDANCSNFGPSDATWCACNLICNGVSCGGGDTNTTPPPGPGPTPPGPGPTPPGPTNKDPIGWHDGNDNNTCTAAGWADDQDVPSQSINVHVYRDGPAGGGGTMIGAYTANASRPDVNQAIGVSGNHGFVINFGASSGLWDNASHQLYIYAINQPAGNNPLLNGSPKSIQCSSSPVSPPTPTPTSSPNPIPVCTPDCSQIGTVCSGQTYADGCGGSCTGTMCCDTSWSPDPSTVCSNAPAFTQTSNCGTTRSASGTKPTGTQACPRLPTYKEIAP